MLEKVFYALYFVCEYFLSVNKSLIKIVLDEYLSKLPNSFDSKTCLVVMTTLMQILNVPRWDYKVWYLVCIATYIVALYNKTVNDTGLLAYFIFFNYSLKIVSMNVLTHYYAAKQLFEIELMRVFLPSLNKLRTCRIMISWSIIQLKTAFHSCIVFLYSLLTLFTF